MKQPQFGESCSAVFPLPNVGRGVELLEMDMQPQKTSAEAMKTASRICDYVDDLSRYERPSQFDIAAIIDSEPRPKAAYKVEDELRERIASLEDTILRQQRELNRRLRVSA